MVERGPFSFTDQGEGMPIYPPQPVAVEYDSRGKRVLKTFKDHYEARRFFALKDKQGKRPKVRKI